MDIVDHSFVIANMGAAPLTIQKVQSSCLCSVGEPPKQPLAPGAQTPLRVRMHLCGAQGRIERQFLLKSDDPYNPATVLYVTGRVVRDVQVRPCEVSFLGIHADAETSQTASIEILDPNLALGIIRAESDTPYFKGQVAARNTGRSYELAIHTVPPLPEGVSTGTIRLVTDNEEHRTIEVPVKADVFGDLVVFPREIALLVDRHRQIKKAPYVTILPAKTGAFELTAITAPNPSIKTQITPLAPCGYRIDLTVSAVTEDLDGQSLRIATDVEGMREILVPIRVLREP